MSTRPSPRISSRKQPQQGRSTDLVSAILQAAIQVLETEGAQRFTTARVAERAGVSIGSLYQYFPNKAAILFRLQSDEWAHTTDMLVRTLQNPALAPLERLRALVHAFIRSECEEAAVRIALADAAPLYRDVPEVAAARRQDDAIIDAFLLDALPGLDGAARARAGDLVITTMTSVGKGFSMTPREEAEITAYADAMADMFCAYFAKLG